MSKEIVQTTKFHLIYQDQPEMDYEKFKKIMFDIQDRIRAYKNHGASLYFTHLVSDMEFFREKGSYPTKEELKDRKGLYTELNELFPDDLDILYSYCKSVTAYNLQKFLKDKRKDYIAGRASISQFKNNQPIDFGKNDIRLYEDNGKHYIELRTFSKIGKSTFGLKDSCVKFEIFHKDKAGLSVVHRCIDGEFTHASGKMTYDKNKKMFEFAMSYKFEKVNNQLNPNNVLGIDLGINLPFVCAINNSNKKLRASSREIDKFRAEIESRRKDMQRSRIYAGEGSVGHGRNTRMKPVDNLGDKIARFRDTKNHAYARQIVDFAVKNNCGTIQMEDLSGISDNKDKSKRKYLKSWSYYDLQTKVRYKAEAEGIKVIMINPRYTSQRCSCCGYISKENRNVEKYGQAYFHCVNCGYEENADDNAANNNATPNIESVIEKQLKVQDSIKTA